jgi:polyphosphate kinase 2
MKDYAEQLEALQVALVKFQIKAIEKGQRSLVIFEGRDTAGKDGAIKRIVEHLSVRSTRVVALPKPTERERSQWYFQRYIDHLPAAGELVIFNRSWYNRAGVERVMGFSSETEQAQFLDDVPKVETMLVEGGLQVIKLWLDVSREEQAKRLDDRRKDPLKALKVSPLDAVAQKKWDEYTAARDLMLTHTDHLAAPWTCVRADHKKPARLAIIRHLLHSLGAKSVRQGVEPPDATVLFPFDTSALSDGRLAR